MTTHEHATRAQERSDATRAKIVQAARELVVERGYDAVSTRDVLERSGVSRGALYHHFEGKTELFAAVVDALERDFIVRLTAAVANEPDPFSMLSAGVQWYLDEALRSTELQRIGLLEGRNALGWDTWRATITPHGFAVLVETLDAAIDAGQIRPSNPTVLAHLLLAMLHEACALILSASDQEAERANTGQTVATLLEGLRER